MGQRAASLPHNPRRLKIQPETPVSRVRDLPFHLAEKMADATMRSHLVPLIYVAVVFFGLPFLAILAFR